MTENVFREQYNNATGAHVLYFELGEESFMLTNMVIESSYNSNSTNG